MKKLYSVVFHTAECYIEAMNLEGFHTYDEVDAPEIEVYWHSKSKRDKAVRLLRNEGITVDTYELVVNEH